MDARTTCFISFIKLLFSFLTKRKTVYEAHTVNSHNSDTVKPHCSRHFRASQPYENTLVDQSKRTYYPNYFIKISNTLFHPYFQNFSAVNPWPLFKYCTLGLFVNKDYILCFLRFTTRAIVFDPFPRCQIKLVHFGLEYIAKLRSHQNKKRYFVKVESINMTRT